MSATITFQPHPDIITPESFIIHRKADSGTPADSFAISDWTSYATVADPADRTYTDATGDTNYLYIVQTVGDVGKKGPLSHILPGHDRSTFARSISGTGYLSHFTPGSILAPELWHEEREATAYVIDEVLRARFSPRQIMSFFDQPLPAMRKMVALWTAIQLTVKHRAHDDDQWKKMQETYNAIVSGFSTKRSAMDFDLETIKDQGPGHAEIAWDWER
ncbi:MAG: hypothetical protein ACI88C_000053 [Acidimicrobiales bacterium]|jgi:hypothetical protein